MNKSELLDWLHEQHRQWRALLDQIGPARMDQPGVNGAWSMKDMVAHHSAWNRRLVSFITAGQRGEPEPPPPWPAHLGNEDEINAWIYEANHGRPARDVLDECDQIFQQLFAVIEGLPDDVMIEPERHLVILNGQRFPAGEFFDHFHEEHAADVHAWLAREQSSPAVGDHADH